jgi:hypothetical protein
MVDTPHFDIQAAHTYFSAHCFNRTWDLIENHGETGSPEQLDMLHTAMASLWHWSQREDVQPENLSVGYWQVSRVYCLLKQPDNARIYGVQALKHARELPPFYKGYAYETLARAAMLENNRAIMKTHLERAQEALEQVTDQGDRDLLAKDLESIQ